MTGVPLPALGAPVYADNWWPYQGRWSGFGVCRLRVWGEGGFTGGRVAVVTELAENPGPSVTNSVEVITGQLERAFPGPLILIEHYPADPASTLKYCRVDRLAWVRLSGSGMPQWAPIWPVAENLPDYTLHRAWWEMYGAQITGDPQPAA